VAPLVDCASAARALEAQARWGEAAAAYVEALRANPRSTDLLLRVGFCFQQQGQLEPALHACAAAARIDPSLVEAWANLSHLSRRMGRFDDAIRFVETALKLAPSDPGVHNLRGVVLKDVGQLEQASVAFRRAAELDPANHAFQSNLLYCELFRRAGDPRHIYEAHAAWARSQVAGLLNRFRFDSRDRSLDRKLRIGYVSAYFRNHAVNFFVEPILASHDRGAFDVYCYSDTDRPDQTNQRLRGSASVWRDVRGIEDERLAQQIHADAIDILIDLSGHLADNRLLVFARKPAPVQMTYIGYQATTGLPNMDWRITDAYCDPPGQTERFHTEKLLRLEPSFFVYKPSSWCPPVEPPPSVTNRSVTFGCMNNFSKVSAECLSVWRDVLRAVPNSRLMLLCPDCELSRRCVYDQLKLGGIDESRVALVANASRQDYIERYHRIDVALDPIPFNGHTTTCDALWMGVPVVTLSGNSYVSRYGAVALQQVGLEDLIATSRQQYVAIAARVASDVSALARLRAELRERVQRSPICDASSFCRELERKCRFAWRIWAESSTT
jgi:predicted O-linked N-acetylglucosamine transferase (SPINDLY family)